MFDIHALQERFYFTDNIIPRYVEIFACRCKSNVYLQFCIIFSYESCILICNKRLCIIECEFSEVLSHKSHHIIDYGKKMP